MKLSALPLGSRFRLLYSGRVGVLLSVSECRARVRWSAGTQPETTYAGVDDAESMPAQRLSVLMDITPNVEVEAL
jgi:hypothetical protein